MNKAYLRLFCVSYLILFLELLLIRLVSTEIRIFAYLSNVLLISIFIGVGMGMLIKRPLSLYLSAVTLFVIQVVLTMKYIVRLPNVEFKLFSGITELLAPLSNSYIWLQSGTYSKSGIIIGLVLTVFLIGLVSFLFVPLGQYLGGIFNRSKNPIVLYSIDVLASLLGMWTFQFLSAVGVSPYFGLFAALILLFFLMETSYAKIICLISIFASIVLLVPKEANQPYEKPVTFWSPYQKLTLSLIKNQYDYQAGGWYLEVNNVGYMGLLDLSQKGVAKREDLLKEHFGQNYQQLKYANQYDLPYQIKPKAQNVLIIGGGAGNDAAAALRAGVGNIDLVEIDPMIAKIGKNYHPEKPYSSKSVKLHTNDGRAFLESTHNKYDIIIMSLADSHTTTSSLSNVQLDNYLYTKEALTKAKDSLSENGALFLTFEVTRPWIGGRIQNTLTSVFGKKGDIFEIRSDGASGWGGIMFIEPKDGGSILPSLGDANLVSYLSQNSRDYSNLAPNLLTDDWPYIYLDKPRIPILHLIVAIISLSALSLLIFKSKYIKLTKVNLPLFMLGVGFMLFEIQNVARSALVFGNTWVTNLFVISGVLLFILAANLATLKKLISEKQAFVILFLTILAQIIIPLNIFNSLPSVPKIIGAMLFLTLPHFFSGIIFASLFAKDKERSSFFGSNLLGSALGGFLAISSYLLGLSSLLYVTIFFYSAGFLLAIRKYRL
ncbi:MAG TPA: hypothetical protein VLE91_04280 [Candidatus Saccharimonadales bacterium]|nr:hypothetical protein [Candidatus Saccharimonadales bacterium]